MTTTFAIAWPVRRCSLALGARGALAQDNAIESISANQQGANVDRQDRA